MSVFIPPVPAATPETWSAPPAESKSATEMDKDTFMKLLVAQLKYQDPLSPADPGEFLAQTAQFTAVEKLEHIATQVSEQTWAMALYTAGSLIGQEITFLRMDGTTGHGVVTSATTDPDGIVLNIDGEEVPFGAVTRIGPETDGVGETDTDETVHDEVDEVDETSNETSNETDINQATDGTDPTDGSGTTTATNPQGAAQ